MKKTFIFMAAVLCVTSLAAQPKLTKDNIDEVIKAMTLEEKATLLVGGARAATVEGVTSGQATGPVEGAAGNTRPVERFGIPVTYLADGPAGLRINPTREGDDQTYYCTHFPIGTLLASTWNQELVEEVGTAIGNEVLEYGADVLLAPALNIHRNPLNGRNFEYYSEDPLIAGKTAAAYVRGVQSNGVGTSIKHFAFNNQETNRMGNDARISARAQREIYLKGFEIAVKEGDPWTVMTSYNKINGTTTSESKELVTGILRDDWGYKGTVMTDWYGGNNGARQVWSGNDMLQPGTGKQFQEIVDAINDGSLDMADLDRNVSRILNLILRSPRFKGYEYSNKPDLEAHAAVTRQSALEGMVLLENKANALPLASSIKNIALFGNTSFDFIAGGTGSGNVNRAYTVSLLDGLKNSGFNVDGRLKDAYAKSAAESLEAWKASTADSQFNQFLPTPLPDELIPSNADLKSMAAQNDMAIITLGRLSGEFYDRTSKDFNLSDNEHTLIAKVCSAFHSAGKKVVVILNVGGVIETASWKNIPDAILCAWQAGQEGGNSVADILTGKQSPSGKLSMTWPLDLMDAASSANFPIDQTSSIDITNRREDSGVKNVDYTEYAEGIYVGYRWFDKQGLEVSYPFGYGLSYTSFEYENASASVENGVVTVKVDIKNVGTFSGKEAVEVYVSAPESTMDKPVKELKAYAKTETLEPGKSQTMVLSFPVENLASFDENAGWVIDKGKYTIHVAASSRDIRNSVEVEI